MRDALVAIDLLIQAANNKITTMFVAAGTLAASQTSSVKSLNEIPITEIFQHDLSALAWTMLIASAWIIVQFLNFAGVFSGIGWLWRRLRGNPKT
jgi:hypothetical protein